MTKTEFLGLVLSGMSDEDLDQTFLEYRQAINGENCGSNMELIDAAVKSLNTAVAALVKTVNGKSPDSAGAVTLSASDVGARASNWMPSASDVGAAATDHTHDKLAMIDQDVKTTASPTFDTVTANKVIGAVYA